MRKHLLQTLRGMLKDALRASQESLRSFLTLVTIVSFRIPLIFVESMGWLERQEAALLNWIHVLMCAAALLVLGYNFVGKIWVEGKRERSQVNEASLRKPTHPSRRKGKGRKK
jgi:hypothetical protein